MIESFIVAAQRTPIGAFQGAFASIPATRLGAAAIKAALAKAKIPAALVDECIMGQVLTAGAGQAPARQAALYASLPAATRCFSINKVCGSGLQAVLLANNSIRLGESSIVVAGGQENMTLAPHLLEASRSGYRMGAITATDSMVKDGLWDPYDNCHMGTEGEMCANHYGFTREQQDEFAKTSYLRAQAAINDGAFHDEICTVDTLQGKESIAVAIDEEPGRANFGKFASLRPAFAKDGTITAANASKVNDGAAALVLASAAKVKELGLQPLARIVAHATYSHEPQWFTTAPIGAMRKALQTAGLSADQIDLYEINEAFSNVTMAAMQELQIPHSKVNVHGGAVALGHPIGASGARILTTLLHALAKYDMKLGMASLCIGGGEAIAVIVERCRN